MRSFVYADAGSNKFWNVELQGKSLTVTWGKAGTKGQTQTKSFRDEASARKEHDKLVREKLAKGYKEAGAATAAPAPSPNNTQVVRSVQSRMREKVSAPIRRARLAMPVRSIPSTAPRPKTKPEQTACRSKAAPPVIPRPA